ncbi:MAG: hypothetical protein AAGF31_06930, partial [Planctomycetota bacterium]
ILRRQPQTKQAETMSRLRSRKAEVREQTTGRQSARYDPEELADVDDSPPSKTQAPAATKPTETASQPDELREESYTERLLKAKKQAKRDREE